MSTSWRKVLGVGLVGALGAALTVIVPATMASATTTDIVSSGPLTDIGISTDLNCSVNHSGDSAGEWYGNTACGTLLASAGTLYGPAVIPAGQSASPRTTWTAVSQTGVTGSGTSGDPFKIVTVDAAGSSGLQVSESDSYVVGQESYRNDVTVTNSGGTTATGVFYRGGDCYLQNSDFGYGIYDSSTGAITCTTSLTAGSRIEQMLPLTAGSNYFEGFYNTLWANIGTQNPLPNTCDCSTFEDNSIGLSWGVNLAPGATKTYSSIITFSPIGSQPVTLNKTADASTAAAGANDGYTITATNNNAGAVTLTTLSDTLGAGFSYRPGTTTGATTADPSINGQTLTWGPITVPGNGTASLHFGVVVSTIPGTYYDDAEGTARGFTVVGTGPTAPVTVNSTIAPTTITTSLSGGGQTGPVISVPAGTSVTDSAVLTGAHAASAGGTVTYSVFTDPACSSSFGPPMTVSVTGGSVPNSSAVTFSVPGTYYWMASYSGDATNAASSTTCGDEKVTVTRVGTPPSIDDSCSAIAGNSVTPKPGLDTTAPGDLLVAYATADGPSSGGQSVTVSGLGLTWTRVAHRNSQLGDAEVWTATAPGVVTNGKVTAKVTIKGFDVALTVVAYKNASGTGAVKTFAAPSGAPTGTVTTTQGNSWVWGVGFDWKASKHRTVGAGQTLFQEFTTAVGATYWVQSQTAPTPTAGTAVTINDTKPTGDPYDLIVVEVL